MVATKLTLDIVPQTCWYSNLRSELPRSEWNRLRRAAYARAAHRCEICGGVGRAHPVECHEVWRYDDEESIQRLERLIALCPSCHEVKHFGLAQVRGNEERALRHLCRVNEISLAEAHALVRAEAEIYEERSQRFWDLDVSVLAEAGVDASEVRDRRRQRNAEAAMPLLMDKALAILLHPLMIGPSMGPLLQRLKEDPMEVIPFILGTETPTGRPTAEAKLEAKLAAGETVEVLASFDAEEACGTAKPRHPRAPCDEAGDRIDVLHDYCGVVLFCYPDAGHSRVYLGEYDAQEGVVSDVEPTTRSKALRFFRKLERGA